MNIKKFFIVIVAMFALVLTGCGTQATDTPNPSASVATPASSPTASPAAKKVDEGLKKFGDVKSYTDGVSISVSEPAPFEATNLSAGVVPGTKQYVYTLVLTNNSDKVLEPMVYGNVSSGGVEAKAIFDVGNPIGSIGNAPMAPVLPGQTIKWLEGYSLTDPTKVTYQVSPSFKYTKVIFTNITK